ncbi:MAG: septation protein SepH [Microcella sp.]|uniref:septation protein SepH n=1 Tax=Microcella sp. TaxID=1913979 RepID=UPI0033164814
MDELTVVGAEDGALIVVSAAGDRFRIPITEGLHAALRQHRPAGASAHRVGPKDIQAAIRSGQSAAEVAAATGEPLEYIERFEGPVLAEREFVISSARGVTVAVAAEGDTGALQTFGTVIDERLAELSARDVRWTAAKRAGQWTLTVSFVDDDVARAALWTFDPKKGSLAPANREAQSLSQQGDPPATVVPRLRAVPAEHRGTSSRFDSGAFEFDEDTDAEASPPRIGDAGGRSSALNDSDAPMNQTADLLEALRKRRGEREAPQAPDEDRESARAAHPSTGSIRIVDIPLDDPPEETAIEVERSTGADVGASETAGAPEDPAPGARKPSGRRGRAAMPSWDEIVFGARPDDDPA